MSTRFLTAWTPKGKDNDAHQPIFINNKISQRHHHHHHSLLPSLYFSFYKLTALVFFFFFPIFIFLFKLSRANISCVFAFYYYHFSWTLRKREKILVTQPAIFHLLKAVVPSWHNFKKFYPLWICVLLYFFFFLLLSLLYFPSSMKS